VFVTNDNDIDVKRRRATIDPGERTDRRAVASRRVDSSSTITARGNADPRVGHVVHARETARGGCV
jgi:hypothetical protein